MRQGEHIDAQLDRVLATQSVTRAQRVLRSKVGWWILGGISFIESALPVPLITDPFLVGAILLNRARAWWFVLLTLLTSLLGGLVAYFTGLFFTEFLLSWMEPETAREFQARLSRNDANTFLITLVGAVTPVPFTLAAWTAGALAGNPLAFIAATVVGRGARYAIVGMMTVKFGERALVHARRYFGLTTVLVILLVAAYLWYKL